MATHLSHMGSPLKPWSYLQKQAPVQDTLGCRSRYTPRHTSSAHSFKATWPKKRRRKKKKKGKKKEKEDRRLRTKNIKEIMMRTYGGEVSAEEVPSWWVLEGIKYKR